MTLVDHLKKKFTAWHRETLLTEQFSLAEYADISEDSLLFDEIVQTQIRVPLWTQLRQIGGILQGKVETGLPIDDRAEKVFFRRPQPDSCIGFVYETHMSLIRFIYCCSRAKTFCSLIIDEYDLLIFRRLFSFFFLRDRLQPNASHRVIEEDLIPVAKALLEEYLESLEREAETAAFKEDMRSRLSEKLEEEIGAL
jgi:hypothetical protein